jgi:isopenicillin N synthase-like dioxygenase
MICLCTLLLIYAIQPTAAETAGPSSNWAPPIIDLGNFLSGDPIRRSRMVQELRQACESTGFFYLANHGISDYVTDAAVTATRTFFALPEYAKVEVHTNHSLVEPKTSRGFISFGEESLDPAMKADGKEVLDIGREEPLAAAAVPFHGPNRWPTALSDREFRDPILAHQNALWDVANSLTRAFALALGVKENYFAEMIDDPCIIHRLNFYPSDVGSKEEKGKETGLRCGAHSDYGFFTLLLQIGGGDADLEVFLQGDNSGGGQDKKGANEAVGGTWVGVPPKAGLINVNLGDLMAVWSNGLFKSTLHRVVDSSSSADPDPRYSIGFFFDPNYEARVEPLAACITPTRPKAFVAVPSAGMRKLAKFEATWSTLERRSGWDEELHGALFEDEATRRRQGPITIAGEVVSKDLSGDTNENIADDAEECEKDLVGGLS